MPESLVPMGLPTQRMAPQSVFCEAWQNGLRVVHQPTVWRENIRIFEVVHKGITYMDERNLVGENYE